MNITNKEKNLIIDFGSQYSRIIERRIREIGVDCEIISPDEDNLLEKIKNFKSIILSGGPDSVTDQEYINIDEKLFNLNIPVLGICYGMQLIHKKLGGIVEKNKGSEFGVCEIQKINNHLLFDDIPDSFIVWSSHNDSVTKLAPGFIVQAENNQCYHAAVNDEKKIYTLQFHPELAQSQFGTQILKNFLFKIAQIIPSWNQNNWIKEKTDHIQKKVKDKNVLLALSGGLDSSVVAHLLEKSINSSQIFPFFIDTGLLKKSENKKIFEYYSQKFVNFKFISASDRFLNALVGIIDPEEKRRIIGKLFIEIFNEYSSNLGNVVFLAQGTTYSDLIESGNKSKNSQIIKSHHNIIGLEEKNNFKLLEPLSDLFKDEIKKMGQQLSIPDWILNQQPFPGPGLAIRISGEVTGEKLNILRNADEYFINTLQQKNISNIWTQAFAILLSSKSVGVKGDQRFYGYAIVLRVIFTTDFMTAEVSNIDINELITIGNQIVNNVHGVARIMYDLTTKPAGTIEWE